MLDCCLDTRLLAGDKLKEEDSASAAAIAAGAPAPHIETVCAEYQF